MEPLRWSHGRAVAWVRVNATATAPISPTRSRVPATLRWAALLNLLAEVMIIITGGVVRVTGSGLGCSTWPQCTPGSYVPTVEQAEGWHKYVEFGNRTLTGLVGFLAIWLIIEVYRHSDRRRSLTIPAWLVLGGVASQAIAGGITVLLGLHPITVAFHFLQSAAIVALSAYVWFHVFETSATPRLLVPRLVVQAGWLTSAVGALVIVLGTVVTGSGPHSGDADDPARFGFDPRTISWLHADAVMLFVGLVAAMLLATTLTGTDRRPVRAWGVVMFVTLIQGVIGYVQYLTKLPEGLVVLHMAGAAALVVALVYGMMGLRDRSGQRA